MPTVKDLQTELAARGLDTKGKKKELEDRLALAHASAPTKQAKSASKKAKGGTKRAAPDASSSLPVTAAKTSKANATKANATKANATNTAATSFIPIDSGINEKGMMGQLGSGPRVHNDYAFLANQTNIGDNNNKFYRGQVLVNAANKYFAWTRWGRVGVSSQCNLDGPTDEAVLVAEVLVAEVIIRMSISQCQSHISHLSHTVCCM